MAVECGQQLQVTPTAQVRIEGRRFDESRYFFERGGVSYVVLGSAPADAVAAAARAL